MIKDRVNQQAAFTLLEMVVVIGIVFLLITLVTVGASQMVQSSRLSEAAVMMENTLLLASQQASLEGREMEVRFYEMPPEAGAPAQFSAFQVFGYDIETSPSASEYESPGGAAFQPRVIALGGLQRLPSGVVIMKQGSYSTLVSHASRVANPETTEIEGRQCATTRIRFLPRGGTDLQKDLVWTLMLTDEASTQVNALPDNYVVLRLDPATSRATIFRPE